MPDKDANRLTLNAKRIISSQRLGGRGGYSLIELLIVIAIFGITISLVTASYLTFERNQRFKNAALQLKNDIRYAQNQALSGMKGAGVGDFCDTDKTLGGWYVYLAVGATSYEMRGVCFTEDSDTGEISNESTFGLKTIGLPRGVQICGLSTGLPTNVLFQPLGNDALFYNANSTPLFFDTVTDTIKPSLGDNELTVSLNSALASGTYNVVVQKTGEVNENKSVSGC